MLDQTFYAGLKQKDLHIFVHIFSLDFHICADALLFSLLLANLAGNFLK